MDKKIKQKQDKTNIILKLIIKMIDKKLLKYLKELKQCSNIRCKSH